MDEGMLEILKSGAIELSLDNFEIYLKTVVHFGQIGRTVIGR